MREFCLVIVVLIAAFTVVFLGANPERKGSYVIDSAKEVVSGESKQAP